MHAHSPSSAKWELVESGEKAAERTAYRKIVIYITENRKRRCSPLQKAEREGTEKHQEEEQQKNATPGTPPDLSEQTEKMIERL